MYRVLMHSSIDENLGCFQVLAVVNSAPMNIGVCFQIMVFFGYMPSNGIVRLFGSSVFRFLRNGCTVLLRDYTSLQSHRQRRQVLAP